MTLIPPDRGMKTKLGDVDKNLDQLTGKRATSGELTAVAQVQATCALVHAVRELTAEVRKLNRQEVAADGLCDLTGPSDLLGPCALPAGHGGKAHVGANGLAWDVEPR